MFPPARSTDTPASVAGPPGRVGEQPGDRPVPLVFRQGAHPPYGIRWYGITSLFGPLRNFVARANYGDPLTLTRTLPGGGSQDQDEVGFKAGHPSKNEAGRQAGRGQVGQAQQPRAGGERAAAPGLDPHRG